MMQKYTVSSFHDPLLALLKPTGTSGVLSDLTSYEQPQLVSSERQGSVVPDACASELCVLRLGMLYLLAHIRC